jgi:hypothetical protein
MQGPLRSPRSRPDRRGAGEGRWLLRICLECGHVGCCDQSPAHANATGHPIIRSLEPGEAWAWCYIDRIGMLTPEVTGSTRIPASPLGA